jgi:WD40 repeat protein
VTAVSWSPDGQQALSGSEDKMLKLWEVSSGQCLRTFQGHTDEVTAVSFCPDGQQALSSSHNWELILWEVSSGQCLRTFKGHTNWVNAVSWSPDGQQALSSSGGQMQLKLEEFDVEDSETDETLKLWEVSTGQCLRTFKGHTSTVTAVSFSPDGRQALSGSDDKTLKLWDVSSCKCLHTFRGHTSEVRAVSWSPDGRQVLSGSGSKGINLYTFLNVEDYAPDETLKLWEVSTGQCQRTFQGHTSTVTAVSFSPDGRQALSGSQDNTLKLWEIGARGAWQAPRVLCRWDVSSRFHAITQQFRACLDRGRTALAQDQLTEAMAALRQARKQAGYALHREALSLWSELSICVPRGRFETAWLAHTFQGHTKDVTSVSWRSDGRQALSGSSDQTVKLWDVVSGQCLRTFQGHSKGVTAVGWGPDGRQALSGSNDETLKLWDVVTGRSLRTFKGHAHWVNAVNLSPDGWSALSGSGDNTLKLWEVASGQCLRTFQGHTDEVTAVSFSPDGRQALSASHDKTVKLWSVISGQCLRTFQGHTAEVAAVSFSPDGRSALSGSIDQMLILWDMVSGKLLRAFPGHSRAVESVNWSPDGRQALSGSMDKTIKLWDLSNGQCLGTLKGHTDWVTAVSWSPDGRYALSGSNDHTMKLWEFVWDLKLRDMTDWDEGARPFLKIFLTLHTAPAGQLPKGREPTEKEITRALNRTGKPTWNDDDFATFMRTLGRAGYGWLKTEGVRRELEKMAANWQGPPPLARS